MNFFQYIENKRFFLLFYAVLMLFVTLMMAVSINKEDMVGNILYTNFGGGIFLSVYVVGEYFYRNPFYKELNKLIKSDVKEVFALIPKPQSHEQKLFIQLLEKQHYEYLEELEQLHNEKSDYQDFIMSWIHEVKIPITACRMLIKNSTGKTSDYLANKFEDELIKIDNYVEQALYYSRIDSFSKDYFITEVSLNQIILESIKKYSKIFINKHIRFNMWDSQEFIYSDSKWLGFVVDQIVTNSLKYTNDGGMISFTFEEDHREKQLVIHDTGPGIKPEDINRVFEKGFTGSTGRNHSKSTGIGLYLAKQLVLKLGHDISIKSKENKYTKVIIHFSKNNNYYSMS